MEESLWSVRLVGISRQFGDAVAVDNVSLSIPEGSLVSLLGPSGCGKTTTLRILAGLENPDEGEVWIDGQNVTGVSANLRPTSMIFQDYALFPHLSVIQNVSFGLKVRGVPKGERLARAEATLTLVGLSGFEDRKPLELSGGQRQRVAMARSLVLEPRVLLLDEPLGALDAQVRRQLQTELRQLQRRLGLTFIYVTHDQEEAMAISDIVAVMRDGRIVQQGSPEQIYRHPNTTFVARFLGDCNLLNGTLTESRENSLVLNVDRIGRVIVDRQGAPAFVQAGDPVSVAIRPEDIQLVPLESGRVTAVVTDRTFLGSKARYLLDIDGIMIEAQSDRVTKLEPGSSIGLTWNDALVTAISDHDDVRL